VNYNAFFCGKLYIIELKHLVIFASGSGSNAENIFNYFRENSEVTIDLIATNNPKAGVIKRAKRLQIPCKLFDKKDLNDGIWENWDVLAHSDLIVLAGFLLKVPASLIAKFPNKIINIHPALLPKYGGKGMFGNSVHKAVISNNEVQSGISIHYVNENYDDGALIFQKSFVLDVDETPDTLAQKIHKLEYKHFPEVIETLLKDV